jgi:hypothetical protein
LGFDIEYKMFNYEKFVERVIFLAE